MSVLRKRDAAAAGAPVAEPLGVDLWADSHPGVWEHLASLVGPDGKSRLGSTLTVFVAEGLVKVCLNDRDQQLTCFVTSKGVGQALEALEKGLQGDSLDWRRVKPWKGRKA